MVSAFGGARGGTAKRDTTLRFHSGSLRGETRRYCSSRSCGNPRSRPFRRIGELRCSLQTTTECPLHTEQSPSSSSRPGSSPIITGRGRVPRRNRSCPTSWRIAPWEGELICPCCDRRPTDDPGFVTYRGSCQVLHSAAHPLWSGSVDGLTRGSVWLSSLPERRI